MTDPIDLEARRALRQVEGDAADLTVLEALAAARAMNAERGWQKCLLICYREDGGNFVTDIFRAGLTTLEAKGLAADYLANDD